MVDITREEAQKMFDEIHNGDTNANGEISKDEAMKMFNEIHGESKPPSFGERLKNFGSNVLHGTGRLAQIPQNIGSALAQHLEDLGESTANIPNLLSGGRIPALQHYEVPMHNPDAPESQITEGLLTGAEYASGAGGLAKLGLAGAKKIPAAANLIERLGASGADNGKNLIKNLLNGNPIDETPEAMSGALRSNYKNNLTKSNEKYGLAKKLAQERGYTGHGGLEKALGMPGPKSINAESSLDKISKLDMKDDNLEKLIKQFKEKPSFNAAHELQSRLGTEGTYFRSSSDSLQKRIGSNYLDARKSLIDDIHKTFEKNNDTDLSKLYKDATYNHKENVIPYQKNRTINQIVTKRDLDEVNPENIHNILAKNDEAVKRVVKDLSPESKNLMIAKELSPSIKQSEIHGMSVDTNKLLEQISKIKNGKFNKILSPDNRNLIKNLEKQLQFEQKYKEPLKNLAKYGGATALGIGGLGGLYGLKKEIFG